MRRKYKRIENERKGEKAGDLEERIEGWRLKRKERRLEIEKKGEKAGD
jgi:hypothetical protein